MLAPARTPFAADGLNEAQMNEMRALCSPDDIYEMGILFRGATSL